ncbi:hypothetical protein SEA_EVEPICKLES_88 [Arthrobacter phage EvePickles]|nr:hypothetical protein SEA_EVEPICKLES_88 [Arthrobacter phage EvePickles]
MTEQQDNQRQPWRVQVSEGEMPTIETIVAQALGTASTCWENISAAGLFDSEEAANISKGASDEIRKLIDIEALDRAARERRRVELPDEVWDRWGTCSREEAIRQCEDSHKNLVDAFKTIDALRAKLGHEESSSGPEPGPAQDPWQGARDDDKLHLIRALLDGTTAFGSDMARFKRQLELIVNA